ncbi:MAG: GTPase ObgE [Clostridia bacterium]|nr:GTPase ObgE [Clostridia bacterium]
MFVDKAELSLKAGDGGNGIVSFRKEKYVPDGGPDGGDGGKGADIIAQVDQNLRTLMDFKYKKQYKAQPGENGRKKKQTGKDGENLVIMVPPGTIIRDNATGKIIADLMEHGERRIVAKGGKGGRGNYHFTTPVRQAPTFAEQGKLGQERMVTLELKMIADVGLVGYPNVGKSTLLSTTTKAKPKIANYHFTTLTPNLGVVEEVKGRSFVLADIPGLIEGAHEGIGLGHDFLRHVERTRVIIHVVDVSGIEGRTPIEDFERINEELEKYNEKLARRVQVVAGNKTDIAFDSELEDGFREYVESRGMKYFSISAATGNGVKELMLHVTELLDNIEVESLYDEADLLNIEDEVFTMDATINYYTEPLDDDDDEEAVVYVAEGVRLERLVYSTNFEDIESLRRFQNILMQMGVFAKFKEMGCQNGDTVRIEEKEFEFFE